MGQPHSSIRITVSCAAPNRLWLIFFARDPFPDVRRTVAKRDPVAFARAKEPNGVSIHEDNILEIQHDSTARRFSGQLCRQFAEAFRFQATAQGQDDVAVCLALDFQHWSSARMRAIARPPLNAQMLNLQRLELVLTDRNFANW